MSVRYIKAIAFIHLFFVFTAAAMAGETDYQAEAGYSTLSREYDNNDETDGSLLYFALYLDKVIPGNQPLAEADFLQRVSHFMVAFADASLETHSGPPKINANGDLMQLQYTYLQKDSPLILGLQYSESNTTTNPQGYVPYKTDSESSRIRVGSYLAPTTAWYLDYTKGDTSYSPAGYAQNDYTTTTLSLNAKHLVLSAAGTAIGIKASIGNKEKDRNVNSAARPDEKNTILTLSADYYFTNRYSAGLSLTNTSGDDNGDKGREIAINGQFFLTTRFQVAIELAQFSGQGTSIDYNDWFLSAAYRF